MYLVASCLVTVSLLGVNVAAWTSPLETQLLLPETTITSTCDCTDVPKLNNSWFTCDNAFLGPRVLPWRLPLLSLVSNYDRYGDLTPKQFLDKWLSPNGRWKYPEANGFVRDTKGQAINGTMILVPGTKVDRFGAETGTYVSAADAPFAQRALPPNALNVCPPTRNNDEPCQPKDHPWSYHVYEVLKEFEVVGGPIAPAFEQPGLGAQFYIGATGSIKDCVAKGFLKRLKLADLKPGPGKGGACGLNPVNCTCERPVY